MDSRRRNLGILAIVFVAAFAVSTSVIVYRLPKDPSERLAAPAPAPAEVKESAEVKTVTYLLDADGSPRKVCDSLGYGVPETKGGKWIRCLDPETKNYTRVLVEVPLIISTFKFREY
jgi:hypothetical protein